MGKGTIISGGENGLYQVQINYNRTRYEVQLADLATLRASLVISEAAEPDANKKALISLQILSVDKRSSFITSAMPDDQTVAAWCADLTEDLSGAVGTIEVPGELVSLIIQPGYEGNAAYSATRDGQILPTIAQTSEGAFYNLAMLPGWQKWKPISRYATITAITDDVADVTLETTTSTQQNLVINQAATLSDVDIEYLDCNGGAFEVGDEVLVMFTGQDWAAPKIVGFKDNPAPCDVKFFIKPRFNNNLAVLGGEGLYFTIPGADEFTDKVYGTTEAPPPEFDIGDVAGLCGPFTVASDLVEAVTEDIDIKFKNNAGQTYFNANEQNAGGDLVALHQYYLTDPMIGIPASGSYSFTPPTWTTIFQRYFKLDYVISDLDLLTYTTETIEGTAYRIYDVYFDDLKKINNASNYEVNFEFPYVDAQEHQYDVATKSVATYTEDPNFTYVPYPLFSGILSPSYYLIEDNPGTEDDIYLNSFFERFKLGGYSSVLRTGWVEGIASEAEGVAAYTIWTDERGQNPAFRPSIMHANFNTYMFYDEVKLDGSYIVNVPIPGYPYDEDTNWNFGDVVDNEYTMVDTDSAIY